MTSTRDDLVFSPGCFITTALSTAAANHTDAKRAPKPIGPTGNSNSMKQIARQPVSLASPAVVVRTINDWQELNKLARLAWIVVRFDQASFDFIVPFIRPYVVDELQRVLSSASPPCDLQLRKQRQESKSPEADRKKRARRVKTRLLRTGLIFDQDFIVHKPLPRRMITGIDDVLEHVVMAYLVRPDSTGPRELLDRLRKNNIINRDDIDRICAGHRLKFHHLPYLCHFFETHKNARYVTEMIARIHTLDDADFSTLARASLASAFREVAAMVHALCLAP